MHAQQRQQSAQQMLEQLTAGIHLKLITCDSSQYGDDGERDSKVGEGTESSVQLLSVSQCCKLALSAVLC